MRVSVINMEEQTQDFEVLPNWTVANLKAKVCQRSGDSPDDFRLIFQGKNLQEEERLDANNIQDGAVIHLVGRSVGGLDKEMN